MHHSFLQESKLWKRAYVLPFIFAHTMFAVVNLLLTIPEILKIVLLILLVILNLVFFFATFWSIDFKARSNYKSTMSTMTTHAKVFKDTLKHGKIRKYIVSVIVDVEGITIELLNTTK